MCDVLMLSPNLFIFLRALRGRVADILKGHSAAYVELTSGMTR